MAKFEIKSVVLCDEVRREAHGTAVIVGASLKGPDIPDGGSTVDRLALYLEASIGDASKVNIRLRSQEHKTSVIETTFDFSDAPRPTAEELESATHYELLVVMVVNKSAIKVPGPGRYDLQIRTTDGKPWKTYRSYIFPTESSEEEEND